MKTLNQIRKIFKTYFEEHALINSSFYVDDFDFNGERGIVYPVANVEYINSGINGIVMNHNYRITLASMTPTEDNEAEHNVHSDMSQIAEDLFTYFQNLEGLIYNRIGSITPFTNDTGDRTSGIVFNLTLGTIRPQNRCWTPTK
jgi:hypothetical protein